MTDVVCKNCDELCDVKSSKSEKNPGKEYYACPSRCKGVWNGWVEDGGTTSSSTVKPVARVSSDIKCTCGAYCIERTSFTPKNKGKKFWACPSGCKVWNGWITDVVPKTGGTPKKPTSTTSTTTGMQGVKRSVETAAPPPIVEQPKFKIPKISHHCEECDKIIDIDHELDNNVARYAGSLKYSAERLKLHLRSELQEAITSGEYTCEQCLGNE
jgi:hypothetical protein